MSRGRKKPYEKKAFESDGMRSDTSANIYMSMLLSKAWRDLSPQQQRLYLYCKAQYYAEKRKPLGDSLCFTMNQSKWSSLYGLYERSNARGFYRDMAALMDHGFVECLVSGRATRTKNIYRFSSAWTAFGTEDFQLPEPLSEPLSEMHVSLA
jgi:hypothetical protein